MRQDRSRTEVSVKPESFSRRYTFNDTVIEETIFTDLHHPTGVVAYKIASAQPVEIVIDSLQPNLRYYYEFRSRRVAEDPFAGSGECTFHTPRPQGSRSTFTITADSHLDEQTDPAVYRQTLANALADAPDFHIDLGDTFMTEKHANRESAAKQYVAQRYYFGLIGHSAPLYLVLGNHDGERGPRETRIISLRFPRMCASGSGGFTDARLMSSILPWRLHVSP